MGSFWKTTTPNGASLGVWKLEEELEELEELLEKKELAGFPIPSSGSRRKRAERLAVRLLVKELFPQGLPIHYEGRIPRLPLDGHRISITHDREMVGVQISRDPIPAGVDLQKMRPRQLERVANRFLNEREMTGLEKLRKSERSSALNILWCAKEALYKGASNTSLREGMEVEAFKPASRGDLEAKVRDPQGKEGAFHLEYRSFGDHHFVHIVEGGFL